MSVTHPAHVVPIGNSICATPQELTRQSAYFADVFMTRHLLDAMPESGTRFTLSLPAMHLEET
jgi:hypothetical protein